LNTDTDDLSGYSRARIRLLFLSANPDSAGRLALDEEARVIQQRLRASAHRDAIEFRACPAARPDDLLQALNEVSPTIVHFSGHGHRDAILLQDDDGVGRPVSTATLKRIFAPFAHVVRLVLLNACFSHSQAKALASVVDCTIGLSAAIEDEAARTFAGAFYRAVGFGCSIDNALRQGIGALHAWRDDGVQPRLFRRRGIDASKVLLLESPTTAPNLNDTAATRSRCELTGPLAVGARAAGSTTTSEVVAGDVAKGLPMLEPRHLVFEVIELDSSGLERTSTLSQADGYAEHLADDVWLEMVNISSGSFRMGSDNNEFGRRRTEGPCHEVVVKSFALGRFPITQLQWRVVAAWPRVRRELSPTVARFRGDMRPVEWITWSEAVEFCERLSAMTGRAYRLPSEAEWEFAARAGTTTPFHFGEAVAPEWVNYDGGRSYGSGGRGRKRAETTPVGAVPRATGGSRGRIANAFGLCDVHGNVGEWCRDTWHDSYQGAPADGSAWLEAGDLDRRVVRGGSWLDSARDCRSAARGRGQLDHPYRHVGFRLVGPYCRQTLVADAL
jgi:formylglycine-generating enzyme required for sulfatase activity